MRSVIRRLFGLLALAIGLAIVVWLIYSALSPVATSQFRITDVPRLLFPAVLIWQGWVWLRKEPPPTPEAAGDLTLSIFLQGGDFGSTKEREALFALKRRLEVALRNAGNLGEIEEVFGGSECVFYIPTEDRESIKAVVIGVLKTDVPHHWSTLIS